MEKHVGYVRIVARRERARLGGQVDLEELIADGALGLVDAARRFEPGRGLTFLTFAHHRIRGAMLDGLRQLEGGTRRRPGSEAKRCVFASEDPDALPSDLATQEEQLLGSEECATLRRAVLGLPPRERLLLLACYRDDETLEQAGTRLGLSRSWSCRLHARAVGRLRAELRAS